MRMNINWKKKGIVLFSVVAVLYALFLALPLILSPMANSYCKQVEEIIKTSSGLDAKVDGIGITTSPKLAIGVKIKGLSLFAPSDKMPVIEIEDARADLRLLPLIIKKVQLGNITAEEINANIVLKNDGIPEIIDYLPKQNINSSFKFYCVMKKDKFEQFSEEDKNNLLALKDDQNFFIHDIQIRNPNNPAQLVPIKFMEFYHG